MKKIFIAGTGRSGTTILHRLLSSHPLVCGAMDESKFIVEGDGLNVLVPKLSDRYSITASDLALIRFRDMMYQEVANPPLAGLAADPARLDVRLGAEHFHEALENYLLDLTDFEFKASPIPRHFEDRQLLVARTAAFVSSVFDHAAAQQGATHWVDKTPANLLALDFLWELFPDAVVIHIKRDPRGVLDSFMRQPWLPDHHAHCTALLASILARWERLKPRLDLNPARYLELKLEDLVAAPQAALADIGRLIGLPLQELDTRMLRRDEVFKWEQHLSAEARNYGEQHLARYFASAGYEL